MQQSLSAYICQASYTSFVFFLFRSCDLFSKGEVSFTETEYFLFFFFFVLFFVVERRNDYVECFSLFRTREEERLWTMFISKDNQQESEWLLLVQRPMLFDWLNEWMNGYIYWERENVYSPWMCTYLLLPSYEMMLPPCFLFEDPLLKPPTSTGFLFFFSTAITDDNVIDWLLLLLLFLFFLKLRDTFEFI